MKMHLKKIKETQDVTRLGEKGGLFKVRRTYSKSKVL